MSDEPGNDWGWVKKGSDWLSVPAEVCTCGATSFPCAHDEWLTANSNCADCNKPLASPEEMESGLCLLCLNGPVPR